MRTFPGAQGRDRGRSIRRAAGHQDQSWAERDGKTSRDGSKQIPYVLSAWQVHFGLSYHLLSGSGEALKFYNATSYFEALLQPESILTIDLSIHAPAEPGSYLLELDLIWEGMWWLKDKETRPHCRVDRRLTNSEVVFWLVPDVIHQPGFWRVENTDHTPAERMVRESKSVL